MNMGGIYAEDSVNLIMKSTILAENQVGSSYGPNCYGTIDSGRANLIDDTANCTTKSLKDTVFSSPQLDALADNGGPTGTHALQSGSPAIDAGFCVSSVTDNKDQRSSPRVSGVRCNIGSYEKSTNTFKRMKGVSQ